MVVVGRGSGWYVYSDWDVFEGSSGVEEDVLDSGEGGEVIYGEVSDVWGFEGGWGAYYLALHSRAVWSRLSTLTLCLELCHTV